MSAELKRDDLDRLRPFVTGLVLDWLHNTPTTKHKRINGSLAFVDISGFTALTERLAVRGKVGAEEMSGLLNATFASLLGEAYHYGASLVKWGGDAVLLLFEDDDHASLACRASYDMRATMRRIGRLHTSRGFVQLRMSIGIHSGEFDFFLAGTRHKEMLVAGPAATKTARMEQTAEAGEIVVSPETAAAIPAECIGAATGPGLLLRAAPEHYQRSRFWIPHPEIDPGAAMDPAIRERLITSLDDSEHRQVGVAFVEVTGVDDILANHGPGAVAGALHEVMTIVQEECDRHRITLWDTDISADGYKTMLIAGAPRRTGHDEDGLVRAARAILDRYDGPVHLRVGLNHGRVFTGAFGPYFRRTWSVNGDAVNLAARVMGKAADGQLLATQAILDRVSGELQTTALEPFVVKGKTQLIHASVVHGVGPARGGPDALDDTVFVGREAELAGLRERVAEARSGYGAAVVIGGDPGIGKTALVEQALADLPTDVTVVRGYADDYSSATPYFAIGTVLRGALGIAHDATDAAVTGHVTQRLTTAAPHLLDQLPLLMAAFGIALDDTPTTAAVQEQFRPARTVTVTTELMQHLLARPTVIVLEDLHSADAASLDILAALAGAAPTRPWLLVLVGRGGPSGDVMTAVVAETLQVLPLSDDVAHAVVIENGGKGFPPHVVRSLVQRADGNPLFLRELVAATAAGQSDALPDTLEELLAAQVDDLPPQLRQVVRVAAVLGHRVDDALLTSLLGESVTAESWSALNRYVAADAAGDRVFRTKLLRDAAYEGLPYRRRIELHGQAATAIGAAAHGREADVAEALSLHSLAALRYEDAWRYSLLAGRQAQHVHAHTEALVFYGRARHAARHVAHLDPADIAALLEATGDAHARLAEIPAALAAYQEARRRAPATDRLLRSRVALNAGLVAERAGSVTRAARWFGIAQRESAAPPGGLAPFDGVAPSEEAHLVELGARVRVERAFLRHTTGHEPEARRLCEQAIDAAGPVGADDVVGRALLLLDMIDLRTAGSSDERRVRRALALFERCDDLPRQAGAWNHLGMTAYFSGEWDTALAHYRNSQQAHIRSGDEWSAAIATANIGEILVDQGRLDDAEPLVVEALRVWRASGTTSDIGFGSALLGRLAARRGRHADALALLSEAATAYSAKDEHVELCDVELRCAEVWLLQANPLAAREHLSRAEAELRTALRLAGHPAADADALPPIPPAVALIRSYGCSAAQLGDRSRAVRLLDAGVALARLTSSTHELALSLAARAWTDGAPAPDEARVMLDQLGVIWTPELPMTASTSPVVVLPAQRQTADQPASL